MRSVRLCLTRTPCSSFLGSANRNFLPESRYAGHTAIGKPLLRFTIEELPTLLTSLQNAPKEKKVVCFLPYACPFGSVSCIHQSQVEGDNPLFQVKHQESHSALYVPPKKGDSAVRDE